MRRRQLQGQLLAAGRGGTERRPVAVRDADEDDPPTRTNRRDRVGERVVATGLERHVDRLVAPVVGSAVEDAGPLGNDEPVGRSHRTGGRHPVRQPIRRDDDRGTRPTQELDEQEPDRTAAVDADPGRRSGT